MKRLLSVGLAFAALFVATVGAAPLRAQPIVQPEVTVPLGADYVTGRGWIEGTPLTVTLLAPGGATRAACTATPGTAYSGLVAIPGHFTCRWGSSGLLVSAPAVPTLPPAVTRPGDRVVVEQGSTVETSPALGKVAIDRVSPATDKVFGRVPQQNRRVFVRVSPQRFFSIGPPVLPTEFELSGRAAGDGTYALDLSAAGDIRRFDTVDAGYATGIFRVVRSAMVPGISAQVGTSGLLLGGYPGRRYAVRLFSPEGLLRAAASVTIGSGLFGNAAPASVAAVRPFFGAFGNVLLSAPNGRPVPIRSGDRIEVAGWSGFACAVPRLLPGYEGGDVFVLSLPETLVSLNASNATMGTGRFGLTDAGGRYSFTLPPEMLPPQPGDMVSANVMVRGNSFSAIRFVAP